MAKRNVFDPSRLLQVAFYQQEQETSCGAACIRMLLAKDGVFVDEAELRHQCMGTIPGTRTQRNCRNYLMLKTLKAYGYYASVICVDDINATVSRCLQNNLDALLLCHASTRKTDTSGHFMLVTNEYTENFYVNDPLNKDGQNRRIRKNDLIEMSTKTSSTSEGLPRSNVLIVATKSGDVQMRKAICPRCGNAATIPEILIEGVSEYVCEHCDDWRRVNNANT